VTLEFRSYKGDYRAAGRTNEMRLPDQEGAQCTKCGVHRNRKVRLEVVRVLNDNGNDGA